MTEKQKIFVDEYLIDFNATRAYLVAYKSVKAENVAAAAAARLLRNVKVTAYIQKRQADRERRTEISQDRVLKELAAIGFADIGDFASVVERTGNTLKLNKDGELVEEAHQYTDVEIRITEDIPPDKRGAVAGIKQGANGIEIKLNDKVKALELLGRHLGMFTDKVEHSGSLEVKADKLSSILDQLKSDDAI